MPLHAVAAIDDAVARTRARLLPAQPGEWLKLAGVCALVGGFGSAAFTGSVPGDLLAVGSRAVTATVERPARAGVLTAAGAVVVLALFAYLLVRSLLEFVLYDALVGREVRVRRSLAGRWRLGLGLFVFRAVLVWSLLGTVLAGAVLAAPGTAERATAALPADVDLDSPVAALVLAAAGCYAVLAGLTTRFVAPIMLVEEVGVLAGWRRLLGLLAGAPHQYLAYLLVSPFVRFAADVLALSAAVLLVVALTIPLVAVVVPVAVLLGSDAAVLASPAAVGVALGLLPAYLLAVAAGAVVLRVPFVAYVRYYALLVLVGTDPELSL